MLLQKDRDNVWHCDGMVLNAGQDSLAHLQAALFRVSSEGLLHIAVLTTIEPPQTKYSLLTADFKLKRLLETLQVLMNIPAAARPRCLRY